MLKDKKRRIELDLARTFAIMCVLLCHATEAFFSFDKFIWEYLSNLSKYFIIFYFTIGRLGVPIFLFLTGTLILKKKFDNWNNIYNFYKKNLISLIIVNSIWVIIYNIFFLINNQSHLVSPIIIIEELLLIRKVPLSNMWYLVMIIPIYIILPFISKLLKKIPKKVLYGVIIIIFIYRFILPMLNVIFDMIGINYLYIHLSPHFEPEYILYIVLGYFLDSNNNNQKKNNILLLIIAILSFTITYVFQVISYSNISKSIYEYNVWYNFPFLLICALCIFKLLLNIDKSKINKKIVSLITFISKTSLSTFFLHIIIQTIITPYIATLNIEIFLKIIILFLINFTLCLILNILLSKIKIISKYVMLIKN